MAWQAACPRCSASVAADARTCPSCGTDLTGQVLLLTDRTGPASAPATVVTAGGGRRPGWAVVAATVAAVVAVLALLASLGGDDAGTSDTAGATTTTAAPESTVPPAGTPGGRGEVTAREGTLLPGDDPPSLLVDDGSLAMVDLATGRVSHPGTPVPIDLDSPILPREGGVVVVDRAGSAHALSSDLGDLLADLGPARPLPSATADRVWLTAVDRTPGGGVTVEERSLAGERTSPSTALLPEVAPVGGVDGGLLLQTPAGIYLLPPGGAPRRAVGGQYLGAGGATVARYDCEGDLTCVVHLTNVATGTDVVPQLGGGALGNAFVPRLLPGVAVFSPDGRLAAVACACAAGEGVAVVSTATGEVLLEANGLNDPRWSPDGRWLFGTSAGIVYAWPAEGGDLRPLDVALRGARLVAVVP